MEAFTPTPSAQHLALHRIVCNSQLSAKCGRNTR